MTEDKNSKRIRRYVFSVILCAAALLIAFKTVMLVFCDKIMIFGYSGLENMFRPGSSGYSAAMGSLHTKVPGFAVKLLYPEEKHNGYSVYSDDDTPRYFVQLIYSPGDYTPRKNTVEHGHYDRYTIEYSKKGPVEHSMDIADDGLQAAMLSITEKLYDLDHIYDPANDKWTARSGDGFSEGSLTTVTSFMLYCHENGYLVVQNDKTVYSFCGSELKKIMDVPEKASFDYCIWKR